MKRSVQWSIGALADLKSQIDYIADENPAAARRISARIRKAVADLGQMATGRRGRVEGTYEKVVRSLPYIVAYAISSRPGGGEVVTVLRVIHGARDWPSGEWPK